MSNNISEELKREIEEAALKTFGNGDGNDTRFDYLQELRREGFTEGALHALTTESLYSKAGLLKKDEEYLLEFLTWMNDNGLINNYDFDYEKTIKKFLKQRTAPPLNK